MLKVHTITGGYGGESIIENVSFEVKKGEIFGILGPNGSGKTTLLKMISGSLPFQKGQIHINGKAIVDYSSKELARTMAVLPQHSDSAFTYSVYDIVALGRYPYQKGMFHFSSSKDEKMIEYAMKQTDVYQFRDKSFLELSGGERQRVLLARSLAQEPKLLLLDEPTNHLDISFQMSLLDSLKEWSREHQLTVISILHDLNMASLYCDRILLLDKGETVALNRPVHVMEEGQLQEVYQANICRKEHPSVPRPLITLVPKPNQQTERSLIDEFKVTKTSEMIRIDTSLPLKVLSSAVIGAGFGWYSLFVNRHVSKDYNCDCVEKEFKEYLRSNDIDDAEAVGMMTAAYLEDASFVKVNSNDISLFVMVTAGVGNAVDASKAYLQSAETVSVGTINTWVLIEGELPDAAYVQAMMTATEAKVKAMHDEQIKDPVTGTVATGTSTDSLLIAATQSGTIYEYAGTITPLGKEIGRAVYDATVQAIKKNKVRRGIV
ncbi:heme ABC transporter ATP-binding protein [Bacillus sp. FJAT-45350]|uniref:heme ABC transporter ATP-binding protein n=1 Tax=Bacillus sp. FJAT-45350 TaxID=2011014 RepID=UPI000BB75871|nr:heme ABC transporter ATP-binding protein [Bacillus sp. FJAT-45350]